ncbi:unnamed protein product [Citrullus colocynthis]|uniref:Uncharacterized protein n=1 Tax=Citrullus colocynthis TaxID=252529 RepID=A0ABP0YUS2_9ROSI
MGNDVTNAWDERDVSQHHCGQNRVRNSQVDAATVDDLTFNGRGEWDGNFHEDVGCDPLVNESMPGIVFDKGLTPIVPLVSNSSIETPILHNDFGHLVGNVPRMVDISVGCGTLGAGPFVMQPHSSSSLNVEWRNVTDLYVMLLTIRWCLYGGGRIENGHWDRLNGGSGGQIEIGGGQINVYGDEISDGGGGGNRIGMDSSGNVDLTSGGLELGMGDGLEMGGGLRVRMGSSGLNMGGGLRLNIGGLRLEIRMCGGLGLGGSIKMGGSGLGMDGDLGLGGCMG